MKVRLAWSQVMAKSSPQGLSSRGGRLRHGPGGDASARPPFGGEIALGDQLGIAVHDNAPRDAKFLRE